MKQNDDIIEQFNVINQNTVSIPMATFIRLHKLGANATQLYNHYYLTALWQSQKYGHRDNIHATDTYCRKGLGWGKDKFGLAKEVLLKEGFIESVTRKDKHGRIVGHYIKVNYFYPNQNHTPENPDSGDLQSNTPDNQSMEFPNTNTKDSNLNTKKPNNFFTDNHPISNVIPSIGVKPTSEVNPKAKVINTSKVVRGIRKYSQLEQIQEDDLEEIATRLSVSLNAVIKKKDELELYCRANGKKYSDYKAAIESFVKTGIQNGEVEKIIHQKSTAEIQLQWAIDNGKVENTPEGIKKWWESKRKVEEEYKIRQLKGVARRCIKTGSKELFLRNLEKTRNELGRGDDFRTEMIRYYDNLEPEIKTKTAMGYVTSHENTQIQNSEKGGEKQCKTNLAILTNVS